MDEPEIQTNVRLPKSLKEWLVQQAANNRRSLTAEICHVLDNARQRQLAADKKAKP